MARQHIPATELERRYIARRMTEADVAEALAKEVFTMFCEGHGIPGATFVGIDGEHIVVVVPEKPPAQEPKPELVKEVKEA